MNFLKQLLVQFVCVFIGLIICFAAIPWVIKYTPDFDFKNNTVTKAYEAYFQAVVEDE